MKDFIKERPPLTIENLIAMKADLPKVDPPPSLVMGYQDRTKLEYSITPVSPDMTPMGLPDYYAGVKIFASEYLIPGEAFKCKDEEAARDLVGFIQFSERFGIKWRDYLGKIK